MSNPGYPEIGGKKGYLQSYNIHLVKETANSIATVATEKAVDFTLTADGVQLNAANSTQTSIFNVNGQKIWEGVAPAKVSLPKGMYILSTAEGNTKFVR